VYLNSRSCFSPDFALVPVPIPVQAATKYELVIIMRGEINTDAGAAGQLAELLRAVAAYAVGGTPALADLRTDAARKLLGQVKGRSPE
jgi:hypothetical protein